MPSLAHDTATSTCHCAGKRDVVAYCEPLEIKKALVTPEDAENSDEKEVPSRDADPTSHSDSGMASK